MARKLQPPTYLRRHIPRCCLTCWHLTPTADDNAAVCARDAALEFTEHAHALTTVCDGWKVNNAYRTWDDDSADGLYEPRAPRTPPMPSPAEYEREVRELNAAMQRGRPYNVRRLIELREMDVERFTALADDERARAIKALNPFA